MLISSLRGVWVSCVLASLALACGGAEPSKEDAGGAGANGGSGNGGVANGGGGAKQPERTEAALPGLDVDLAEGVFWEFEHSTYWKGSLDDKLTAHYELGAPSTVDGKTAYPVSLRYSNGNGGGQAPIAQENGIWFEHVDGEWRVLFDGWNGKWPAAGGFFGKLADSGVASAAEAPDETGRDVYIVSWAYSGKGCEMIPGYGPVCTDDDDPSELAQSKEHWLPDLGPFYSRFLGCTSEGCIEEVNVLTAASFGDAAGVPTKPTIDASTLPPDP